MTNDRVPIIETGDFHAQTRAGITPITHSRQLFDVYRMTHECYSGQKYPFHNPAALWIPHPNFDHIPETTILVAELAGEIIGSVSITLDGTKGLPMDEEFARTCALTRGPGRRVAQVWRLLVKESTLQQTILTSLIAEAANQVLSRNVQTSLWVIPEENAEVGRGLLNAVTLMRILSARDLSNACSVIMRAETENMKCLLPVKKGSRHDRVPHLSRR